MNTQMAEALKQAGIRPKSLYERVWLHIQYHPGSTAANVVAVFGASATQAVSDMFARKMLTRTATNTLVKGIRRDIFCYKVAMREYELQPKPAKLKAAVATPAAKAPAPEALEPWVPAAKPPTESDELDSYINGLTVGKAHLLYVKLKKLFG